MRKEDLRAGLNALGQRMDKRQAGGQADMRLPAWVLGLGVACCLGGAVLIALALFGTLPVAAALGGIALLLLGAAAALCYANQKIFILSEDEFEYRTFLGNTRRYRFSEITGLRRNPDSWTLEISGEKVHVESVAHLSPRLTERINQCLEEMDRGA